MTNQTPLNRIDLGTLPAWDFRVLVNGMELPMISPLEAPDIDANPIPEQAEIDAKMNRWPGVWVWLWRAMFGAPRLRREDLPSDGGAAHARKVCKVILHGAYDELVDELPVGNCAQIITAYQACQDEWTHAAAQVVRERASEHLRTKQVAEPIKDHTGSMRDAGMVPVNPGDPSVFFQHRHPMVTDDTGGAQG